MKRGKRLPKRLRQQAIIAAGRMYVRRARKQLGEAAVLILEMKRILLRPKKKGPP